MALSVTTSSVYPHQTYVGGWEVQGAGEKYVPEEGVRENDIVNAPTCRVLENVFVYEEEEWHVDFLSRKQFLLFKTKTLYFRKVWRDLYHQR